MRFDNEAKTWDSDLRVKRAKLISDKIRKSIPQSGTLNAMEFGCGTGLIGFNLLSEFESLTFIDYSEGMIEEVNKKINEQNILNASGIQIDLTKESLDSKFDLIFTSMALHHIKGIKGVLRKLSSLLNKNGRLVVVELDEEDGSFHMTEHDYDGHNGFKQNSFRQLLNETGFSKASIETFYHGEKRVLDKIISYSLFIAVTEKN